MTREGRARILTAVERLEDRGIPARLDVIARMLGWTAERSELQDALDECVWEGNLGEHSSEHGREYFVTAARTASELRLEEAVDKLFVPPGPVDAGEPLGR